MTMQPILVLDRARHSQAATLFAGLSLLTCGVSAQEVAEPSIPVGVPAHETLEDPFNRAVMLEELEARDADGTKDLHWDISAWAGRSIERLTVRSEGERRAGETEHAELQLLWTRAAAPWWEIVAGARVDYAPGSDKTWVAFGAQGLAPYRVGIEATVFVSSGGDAAARFEGDYELLLTNRLILEPQIELNWYGQTDVARGHGTGLASGEAALRLRYEIRRELAPYVGVVRERRWGDGADAARAAGIEADDTRWVAGIRVWF